MKIAIYSRKSKFTGKGDSIGNQIDRCKDYINFIFMEEKNIEIEIFEDEGYSGKNTDRPAFKKMMHMIKMKELDAVIVYQLNRLGRKVKDILETIDIFKEYGTDSRIGLIASIMMSCTETIFYTMSVYFMAAKVRKTRYTLAGALAATLAGIMASVWLATN